MMFAEIGQSKATMASLTTTAIIPARFQLNKYPVTSCFSEPIFHRSSTTVHFNVQWNRSSLSCNGIFTRGLCLQHTTKRVSAADSGLEVSITDDDLITVKDAQIVVESQDENQIQVRVDVNGEATQRVFDKVLTNLARSAPPIPGFRREKGGKTTKVPKSFLLQILGEERVTKFVIKEIVSSTMTDYTKKENLSVKDKKFNTTQKLEELKRSFAPGKDFGFNATLDLEKADADTGDSSEEDTSDSDPSSSDVQGDRDSNT